MRLTFHLSLVALLLGLCAAGCKKQDNPSAAGAPAKMPTGLAALAGKAVSGDAASVNGKTLSRAEVEQQVQAVLAAQGAQIPPEQLGQAKMYLEHRAVQSFVSKTLLLNEAKRLELKPTDADRQKIMEPLEMAAKQRGTTVDEMIRQAPMGEKAARQELEESALIERLIDAQVRAKAKVTDEEVAKELAAQAEKTATNEQLRAAQRTAINAIRDQLLAGSNFEAMAKERSDDPGSGQQGGVLAPFGRGQMVKPFEDAAFSQKVGDIGPVVESQFGFHIIKVTAHNDAKPASGDTPAMPESVQASHILLKAPPPPAKPEDVRKRLENAALGVAIQTYLQDLQAKAKITTMFDQPGGATGAAGPAKP